MRRRRRRGRRALRLLLLALLLAGAGLWWYGPVAWSELRRIAQRGDDEAPRVPPATLTAPAVAPSVADAPPPSSGVVRVPAATPPLPLPAPHAPLEQVRRELEARAQRGDVRAACRLAVDGDFCRGRAGGGAGAPFLIDAAARRSHTDERDVALIARAQAQDERAGTLCAGLPPDWADANVWRYMLQAAQAGDMVLAARFAASPPLDRNRFLEQPQAWDAYRIHARALLERALDAGEPRALVYMQSYLDPSSSQGLVGMPGAIARDPALAARYALVLQRFVDAESSRILTMRVQRLRAMLGAEAWAQVEADAEALAAARYAQQTTMDFSSGVFGELDPSRCETTDAALP